MPGSTRARARGSQPASRHAAAAAAPTTGRGLRVRRAARSFTARGSQCGPAAAAARVPRCGWPQYARTPSSRSEVRAVRQPGTLPRAPARLPGRAAPAPPARRRARRRVYVDRSATATRRASSARGMQRAPRQVRRGRGAAAWSRPPAAGHGAFRRLGREADPRELPRASLTRERAVERARARERRIEVAPGGSSRAELASAFGGATVAALFVSGALLGLRLSFGARPELRRSLLESLASSCSCCCRSRRRTSRHP